MVSCTSLHPLSKRKKQKTAKVFDNIQGTYEESTRAGERTRRKPEVIITGPRRDSSTLFTTCAHGTRLSLTRCVKLLTHSTHVGFVCSGVSPVSIGSGLQDTAMFFRVSHLRVATRGHAVTTLPALPSTCTLRPFFAAFLVPLVIHVIWCTAVAIVLLFVAARLRLGPIWCSPS